MKNILSFFLSFFLIINFLTVDFAMAQNTNWPGNSSTDNVGIGTTNPFARFHVYDGNNTTTGSSVLFEGEIGGTPTSGSGTRLMWIPEKAALRFGRVSNTLLFMGQTLDFGEGGDYWDNNNIGEYSFATGFNNRASAFGAHAIGALNKVDGMTSFAIGVQNDLGNSNSNYAIGEVNVTSNHDYVFLIGRQNTIQATNAMAIGTDNNITSSNSFSVGSFNNIYNSGNYAFGRGLHSVKDDAILIGRNNAGINNNNVAIEFGIGTGQGKNGLTLYNDGAVQFNELPGTGNALAIDNDGFVTRTTASGGGGTSFWQANGGTNEIYYSDDVTIGNTSQNRPSNTNLWVNGSAHLGSVVVNSPENLFLNNPNQKMTMVNLANRTYFMWEGDVLDQNNGLNRIEFKFNHQDYTDNSLSIFPDGTIRGGQAGGTFRVQSDFGNVTIGPKNSSFCSFETSSPQFHFSKTVTVDGDVKINGGKIILENSNGLGSGDKQVVLNSDGTIHAREIKVDLQTIPDYVFAEGYELMPLEELEEFVKTNKHLPGVKSEAQFEEEGSISLTEMNLKLLEKVEELTLYILQQQNDIQTMQTQINLLKNYRDEK
jgi:hypothetical protein